MRRALALFIALVWLVLPSQALAAPPVQVGQLTVITRTSASVTVAVSGTPGAEFKVKVYCLAADPAQRDDYAEFKRVYDGDVFILSSATLYSGRPLTDFYVCFANMFAKRGASTPVDREAIWP